MSLRQTDSQTDIGIAPNEAVITETDASLPAPAPSTSSEQAGAMHAWPWRPPSPSPAPQQRVLPDPPGKAEQAARSRNKTEDNSMFVQTASYATVTQSTLVLYDVGKSQWLLPRPERESGTVDTEWLLLNLLMDQKDRAINADITWVPGYGGKPRSASIMLWNGAYDSAKRRLSYSWAPLGAAANSDALLPSSARGGSRVDLQSVSLFLDSCPNTVPFICCKGSSCNWVSSSSCSNKQESKYNAQMMNQVFSCPTNWVGTVKSSACWDSHTKKEGDTGSCVACHSSNVDNLCEEAFPSECANGACTNSWYPGYWPFFCNNNPTNTPNSKYGSCQCGGVDRTGSNAVVKPTGCWYVCPTSALWCSAL